MNKWKEFDAFYNDLLGEVYHEPDSVLTSQVTDSMLPVFGSTKKESKNT